MNTIMNELWPFILTALLPAIGLYIGYIHQLKTKVAVMEKTLEDQQKTLDNMQKRMDNHSKKQDDILQAIASMKVDIVKQLSQTDKQISTITARQEVIVADVQSIKQTISIIEKG